VRAAGPDAPPRTRLAAAIVIAWAGGYVAFRVLGALSLFHPVVALAIAMPLAVATLHPRIRGPAWQALRADARAATHAVREAGTPLRVAMAATSAIALARLVRGLSAPPLAFDALTYHLARAATWVRHGDLTAFAAPDAWRYCARYPDAGDSLWAWALLPGSSDAMVPLASAATWAATLAGGYVAARALGGTRRSSIATALCVGTLPPVLQAMTAAYVDLPALALLLLGIGLAGRHAALAVLALALAAATRAAGLPWLAIGLAALARPRNAVACVAAAAIALPTYLDTWIATGNPLYPLPLSVAGVEVFAGSPEFLAVHSGAATGMEASAWTVLAALFVPTGLPHLNLGPSMPLLAGLGIAGALGAWRPGRRAAVAIAVAGAAVTVAAQLSGEVRGFLVVPWWLDKVGRFLLPAAAALIVLAAPLDGRIAAGIRVVAIGTGLALGLPLGWSGADVPGVLLAAACLVPAAVLVAIGPARRWVPAAVVVALAVVPAIRSASRYPTWAAAARGDAWDLHPASRSSLSAWPSWQALDGPEGRRVALTAGFDGVGHNWYTWPWFGSRLQNDVFHVPATRGGEIPDYAFSDATAPKLDRDAWIERLLATRADVLVALDPPPPERAWAESMPEVFRPLAEGPWGRAWSVDRAGRGSGGSISKPGGRFGPPPKPLSLGP